MFANFLVLVLLANVGYIITESFAKLESDASNQQVPCIYSSDCAGRWNICSLQIGDQTFCQCKEGSSGDNCTVVDQCRDGLVDCGTNNNASCMLGDEGKAYCHCDNEYQGYVEQTKTCRDCDCGDSLLNWGCQFGAEGKKCDCEIGAYQNHEGKCIDCGCGDGAIRCTFKEGVKTCKCFDGFASNGSSCINCECGPNAKCAMEGGIIVCTCNEGYLPSGSKGHICLMQCNASNPCENGGTCSGGACLCRNGTGGDLCREVEDCHRGFKCGEADCLYDVDEEEAYCKCRDPDVIFEPIEKKCRVCDCGSHSKSCRFSYTFKNCTCDDLFDDLQGTCTSCSCGGLTRGCHFDRQGTRICQCAHGYAQSKDECKKCNCGYGGVCEFDDFFEEKRCKCNKGYESDGQVCLPCDCGDNGTCSLHAFGEARCSCHEGFEVYQGKCLACECGVGGNCSFEKSGTAKIKTCICSEGFAADGGTCKACECGVGGNCSFERNGTATIKTCICPEGLSDDGGTCKECDCQLEGSNCTFTEGLRTCRCPQGFKEAKNSSNQLTFCQDVDECLDSASCPKSATCVNTIGSYECYCGDEKTNHHLKLEECPTGKLGTWAIAGIVAGCVIGVLVIIGGIDEYKKKYGLKKNRTSSQRSTPIPDHDIKI